MIRNYIRRNIPSVSIILFVSLFCIVQLVKPAFLYENDGLRQFGLGTRKNNIANLVLYIIMAIFFIFICLILFNNA